MTAAGADATRVFDARNDASVRTTIDGWTRSAQSGGVNAVPTFYLSRRGGPTEPLQMNSVTLPEFRTALDEALRK